MNLKIEQIAEICHEANAAYCRAQGDNSQKPWSEADQWQRQSAIRGVRFSLANPSAPARAQHDAWLSDKRGDGWVYGPIKDAAKKEHPCCMIYDYLPKEQRVKDDLFNGIVRALAPLCDFIVIGSDGWVYGGDEKVPG